MDPLELLHLLGLEVLLVLRQLIDLLLVLAQLFCLFFLYLIEVARQELSGLGILLDYLVLVDGLRLVDRGRLLCDLTSHDTLSDVQRSLHLILLTVGPTLSWHVSLPVWHLFVEYLLGCQLCWL